MDNINQLAKQYSEGKLSYSEYKKRRTELLNNIVKGKITVAERSDPKKR